MRCSPLVILTGPGPTCANKTLPCSVVATGGNPLLFQDWWEQDPDSKYAIDLETDYRTGYQFGGVLDCKRGRLLGGFFFI